MCDAVCAQFLVCNIWHLQLSDISGANHRRFTVISSTSVDYSPQYSPDGKKITATSERFVIPYPDAEKEPNHVHFQSVIFDLGGVLIYWNPR